MNSLGSKFLSQVAGYIPCFFISLLRPGNCRMSIILPSVIICRISYSDFALLSPSDLHFAPWSGNIFMLAQNYWHRQKAPQRMLRICWVTAVFRSLMKVHHIITYIFFIKIEYYWCFHHASITLFTGIFLPGFTVVLLHAASCLVMLCVPCAVLADFANDRCSDCAFLP